MASKHTGQCHICGVYGELSYEHVPPQSAFNDRRIWVARGEQLFEGGEPEKLKREQLQSGAGGYTLCVKCNNDTGRYGRAYADWACQAMEILERARGAPTLAYPFRIYPLRIIKQIVAMFFSANAPDFRKEVPYLGRFVLDKHAKGLPPDIRVHAGYPAGTTSRTVSKSGLITGSGASLRAHAISEVAFSPFVFVLTLASECPEPRLADISYFALAGYDQQQYVYISLPVLPIATAYPTDYRTRSEVDRAAAYALGKGAAMG